MTQLSEYLQHCTMIPKTHKGLLAFLKTEFSLEKFLNVMT